MRPPPSDDAAVAATNDDAQVSKLSAVAAGYFADPWLAPFVRRPARRPPLINLGACGRERERGGERERGRQENRGI
jgi:hypothetical protein